MFDNMHSTYLPKTQKTIVICDISDTQSYLIICKDGEHIITLKTYGGERYV